MIARALNVAAIAALMGSAVYAYSIKYETARYSAEIVKARNNIQRERDAIAQLRAQWAQLSRPERVQALSEMHLNLAAVTVDQIVRFRDLPDKTSKVDVIGRKLEALGLAEPTETPRPEPSAPARSTTPSSVR